MHRLVGDVVAHPRHQGGQAEPPQKRAAEHRNHEEERTGAAEIVHHPFARHAGEQRGEGQQCAGVEDGDEKRDRRAAQQWRALLGHLVAPDMRVGAHHQNAETDEDDAADDANGLVVPQYEVLRRLEARRGDGREHPVAQRRAEPGHEGRQETIANRPLDTDDVRGADRCGDENADQDPHRQYEQFRHQR